MNLNSPLLTSTFLKQQTDLNIVTYKTLTIDVHYKIIYKESLIYNKS